MQQVSGTVWVLTVLFIIGLLLFDFFFHVRRAHVPRLREAAFWTSIYVSIAILFGVGVWIFGGSTMGAEYFAGYVTEEALSVDNLFVFLLLMSSFKVPRADQQKVLLFGIVVSLLARTGFILLGAALINSFAWIFYIFGLILLVTAGNLLREKSEDPDEAPDNIIIRLARRFLHTSDEYDGDKLFTYQNGKRVLTPMLLVMVAIGGTDILFALDSIPAIFGLTQNVYLVFTATAFSLLGLRQLYFLIDGLLDRLVYLSYGLAAILALIGVKLVLHALHENNVPFINDGEPVHVAEIPTALSLGIIVGVLVITVVASLLSPKGRARTYVAAARRHATEFLDVETDPAYCDEIYHRLLGEEENLRKLPERHRARIRQEDELMALLRRAHQVHAERVAEGRCFAPSATGKPASA
ncbi:putative TerC-family integral membrane protein [Actinoplanes missouriensis 431]|uniref:Putative TerC-family integral membrane protein n=1 Tax=Actinoplanes missouriensis (strain ATCC 14538 / DSM 43046 / CBS 188.64 / JCM 3121 / NBRC 102363 / NCIMB 12654 / NRRL B-3342 / UNCC 431) TaxID=512565 RepID=I0HHQ4_ACTM4|nr:TerC family protein [Actinoplanes missouriensis]BAL92541.1 putative TerC-family integral membrane protein [Actinoplanes missouriensis 431]